MADERLHHTWTDSNGTITDLQPTIDVWPRKQGKREISQKEKEKKAEKWRLKMKGFK